MAFLKKRGNILWIKYYDKIEGKYKEFSTKINATRDGWIEARKLLKEFNSTNDIKEKFVTSSKEKLLSVGLEEFIATKKLKTKTISLCKRACEILIDVSGDKNISSYGNLDYRKMLKYFSENNLSSNTQGIYTAHLHSIFNFFIELNYTKENPIKVIKRKLKPPESIDDGDLKVILDFLKLKEKKEQYHLIMFLLITGFRISTALELKWENVDWENGFIVAPNIKRDKEFFFPLTDDLIYLLKEIGIKKEGKIFRYSNNGLKFFLRVQKSLLSTNSISKKYTMHQLRKTFITKLLENGIPIHTVKALADHSNIQTTINYYAAINVKKIKEELNSRGIFRDNFRDNKRLVG
ncbi:MAG: site-specific integrase [Melioribacteraceae bacterium]|nr:site-specific integrase [Melioribacteraceae bacterium]